MSNQPIHHSEGELPVDGLLKEQEAGGKKERTFTLAEALEIHNHGIWSGNAQEMVRQKRSTGKLETQSEFFKRRFNIDLNKYNNGTRTATGD